jgi:arylsulfatase A-like enzyme
MHYDGLLRVGMLMSGPGIEVDKRISSPVSTMDLAATFCDWGGAELPAEAQAKSLVPLIEHGTAVQDHVYNEWNLAPARVGVALELRTIRTETARLTIDLSSGAGELYDLSNDPDEMSNLWDDPAAKGLQRDMMDRVHQRPGRILEEFPEHTE